MLKYNNQKLFSVYSESIFLKWSLFFPMIKGICLYCSSFLLTLFPAWCIKSNSENIGFEI
jgi:hypothetical protein